TSAMGLAADQFKLTENAMALANIETVVVGEGASGITEVKLSGTIVENEEANAVQVSYFSGRIEKLNINFTGEKVQKGQLLATVYSPELYAAQQELITAVSLKETQPALYNAVRNKLKLWKLSDTQINQIERTKQVQENVPIYATFTGTVSEKLVAQGDYIKQGQALLKIVNLNTVWANFDVFENQIDFFKKGQEISITTHSNQNTTFKTKVDFIDPVLNANTRTVKLRAVLNNTDQVFKPGMFVEGVVKRTQGSAMKKVLKIPASAVLWTGERSVVYLKTNPDQPVFEMHEIVVGNQIGNEYEVLEGLTLGDEIVTNGTYTVDAAAQLQGKKSMMNKAGVKTMTGHEGHMGMMDTMTDMDNSAILKERIEVSKAFQNQLKKVFDRYILLKDDLVNDDSEAVIRNAILVLAYLTEIDMKLLKDNKSLALWTSLEKEIKKATTTLSNSKDIAAQRSQFKLLSSSLSSAIEYFGVNEKIYQQYCPMADNNNGAYWLSKDEKVINPYYGQAMLTCGEVKQIIE
ncbi:MAG: efflux RND transporter periplasmic adaptor subunit, partial [Flavobacteriaceae bacterium]